jgi:DNA-binding PadR family transcriptional regulator
MTIKTNDKYEYMDRFIEVCLLQLLSQQQGYGYSLMSQLATFGFDEEKLNVSTIYRTLRKMEKKNLVNSQWEQGDKGPKKRVYKISENGKSDLYEWIEILKGRRLMIDKLVKAFDQSIKE